MRKAAVLGYGTVGSGVVEVIDRNGSQIEARVGEGVEVKYILDLRDFPGDKHEAQVVHDVNVILEDEEISIVCETMGGVEPAYTFSKNALLKGKSVCTSNKELVAAHGPELLRIAKENNCSYLFEASCGGGIPVIRTMTEALSSEKIDSIMGILNGTTNYILTKMDKEGADFAQVLKEAQEKGYAERNPEADVEGYDVCRKIAILSSLMKGSYVKYEDIYTEGITKIGADDFKYAKKMNMAVKLIALAKQQEDGFYAMVSPFLISREHPFYCVNDVFNAVFVHSNVAIRWEETNAQVASCGQMVRRFFVRTRTEQIQIEKVFGQVTLVDAGIAGEYGFVTEPMTEDDFAKKAEEIQVISRIRLLA